MALQWCEGWDAYATQAEVVNSGKYKVISVASSWIFNTTAGKFGGKAVSGQNVGYPVSFRCDVNIPSGANIYVGGWWRSTSGAVAPGNLNWICPSGNLLISANSSGYLSLYNSTTAPLATGSTFLLDGYHWVEVSMLLNGASSSVTAYVDGILQFSGSYNLSNFPAQTVTQIFIGTGYGSTTNYLDDFVIWDSTGTAFNTFPIGARRIGLMNPSGPGSTTQFTPSTGANWQCASQAFSGTAYVADAGTGNSDTYVMSPLPYTPLQNINAVVVNTQANNPAADGAHSVLNKLKSGSNTASGSLRQLTATNVVYFDAFPKDSSGNAWTLANLNAAQAGIGD